jgi:hypothetical protein
VRRIRIIFSRFKHRNNFGALEQFRSFIRRQNIFKKGDDPFFGPLARIFNGFRVNANKTSSFSSRGGLITKSLCGISYKKFFKTPQRPLFVTFCMEDYKSLAAIDALPQWPVRPCFPDFTANRAVLLRSKNLRKDQDRLLILYVFDVKLSSSIVRDFDPSEF